MCEGKIQCENYKITRDHMLERKLYSNFSQQGFFLENEFLILIIFLLRIIGTYILGFN